MNLNLFTFLFPFPLYKSHITIPFSTLSLSTIITTFSTPKNLKLSATTGATTSASTPPMGSTAYYTGCEYENYQPHFLDSCSLCGRSLNHNSDIYMYRGNTPFCSYECRQEQIEMDEASEKRWKISSSKRSNKSRQTSDSAAKESDTNKAVRTGTVAVS